MPDESDAPPSSASSAKSVGGYARMRLVHTAVTCAGGHTTVLQPHDQALRTAHGHRIESLTNVPNLQDVEHRAVGRLRSNRLVAS